MIRQLGLLSIFYPLPQQKNRFPQVFAKTMSPFAAAAPLRTPQPAGSPSPDRML